MKESAPGPFLIHSPGYVRHWLVVGPHSTPFASPIKDDDTFRCEAVDFTQVDSPRFGELGLEGPFGQPWRFHYPGRNYFVEHSNFWTSPSTVDSYACTEIESKQGGDLAARLWAAGTADLWVNGAHLTQFRVPRYMHPDFQMITLPLRRGINRLCLRLQVAALRDTRLLFGLQILGLPELTVQVPSAASLVGSVRWLDTVKVEGIDRLVSELPAPVSAEVILPDGQSMGWPAGKTCVSFGGTCPFQFSVSVDCGGQKLMRHLEIPANRDGLPHGRSVDLRQAHLDYIASAPDEKFVPGIFYSHLPFLTRRMLGRTSSHDAPSFATMVQYINDRRDCSDFALAALLRLVRLGLATVEEAEGIRRIALDFRYWVDEPGSDAMCFHSENHSLLFHGCQFMAGQMYPDEIFSNSGRTGREHIALGLQRTETWLDEIEAQGFAEFLSSTYVPLTVGALLNVVDFSGDAGLSRRASVLIDRLYEDLADHAFQGLTVGPQGRVYRNVLYPEEGGTQTLLSWATPEALPDFCPRDLKPRERTGDWIAFLATSKSYQTPEGLAERMRRPVSRRYSQSGAEIVLHKTADYILTSLAIPRSDDQRGLRPGRGGYQEHLWQATLGPGCHIFVNHPGCSSDGDKSSRPGFWYGNGVLPVVRQREGILQTIFDIPDGGTSAQSLHPIPFTHAHWPADAFEEQQSRGQWIFGRKMTGCIALWCSEQLEPQDDMMAGRELRAPGYRSAWTVVCGGLSEAASFESFIESCVACTPKFDRENRLLLMKGEEALQWSNSPPTL